MVDPNDYLKLNSDAIVDLVEKKLELTSTFEEFAALLQGMFVVVQHGSEVGKLDKAHNVLAEAIICSLWCGWLSQANANRGAYPPEWVDIFKKLIVDAFETGQKYSEDKR
jgi:hypothetical protein